MEGSDGCQMMRFCASDAQKTALLPMPLPLFSNDNCADPTCGHICCHFLSLLIPVTEQ